MASLSEPESISSSNPTGKLHARVSDDSTVAQSARKKIESPRCSKQQTEKVKEKFMSADLFCQKMGGMIEKQDVQSILDIQTETLRKFEKTNAKFGRFNDLSSARYLYLNQQLKSHTKMLLDMKKDLDSVFRRIRNLKTKLAKQYGPAFNATSVGIQKLEEELGASMENEYLKSQEMDINSQCTDQGQHFKQQGTEDVIDQGSAHSVGNETFARKGLQTNEKNSTGKALNFQVNQVVSGTEDKEKNAVSRTESTNEASQAVGTDDVIYPVDTSNAETVDTDQKNQTVEMKSKKESVDDDETYLTVEAGYSVQTVDMSGICQTEMVDADHTYLTVDTGCNVQTVDMSGLHQTQSSGDSSETADIPQTTNDSNNRKVDTAERGDSYSSSFSAPSVG